jgi:hypothetical protein
MKRRERRKSKAAQTVALNKQPASMKANSYGVIKLNGAAAYV